MSLSRGQHKSDQIKSERSVQRATGRVTSSSQSFEHRERLNLLSGGAAFSSSGWSCFFSPPLLLGGAAWFPFSGWCCRFFLSFWWDYFSPVFCWVVLLGPLLLGVVLRPALSPPPLGGVAFPISFQVVMPSFPSFWWGAFHHLLWVELFFPIF